MPTTVELMAEAFEQAGTPFIAGHPGGESVELMEAARQRGMRFILMKQENAGAMLAATWGEITGAPGVCMSTRGPGALNMVNGVAHAFMDRAPLIAITDAYSAPTYETGLRQRLDQQALYAPVVKWNATINARSVAQQLRRAMRVATGAPPGPVHFDLPQSETTRDAATLLAPPTLLPSLVQPEPDRAGLRRPLEMLRNACKPIILAGLGVFWAGASAELVSFAERLGAPVLTTSKGKGMIPEDHRLRAGCIIGGLIERKLVSEAEVVGDLRVLLARLAEWLGNGSDWGEAAARTFRDEVTAALNTPSTGLSPQRAMEVARAVLPRNTIATCDAGASRLLVVQKWQAYGPREFLTSNGLGSMGYAVPGALAARLAHPDGSAGGGVQRRRRFPDGGRGAADLGARGPADHHRRARRRRDQADPGEADNQADPLFGVTLGGVDWAKVAQGFGADGTVVDTEQGLGDALAAALASGRTTVIGVRIDPSGYVEQFNALREL
jgi:acetolactate synthase-1/2/3 large subunit